MDRHLIKYGDNKRLTLVLTNKGKLFRLTTHPGWPIIPVIFAALVAFTIFGLNRGCSTAEKEKSKEPTTTQTIDSSDKNKVFQNQTLKDSGSSLVQTDTTKMKDTTTKH